MGRREDVLKYFEEQKDVFDVVIKDGIEKYRKGDTRVYLPNVKDGTKVHVTLKNHAFRFGANCFMLNGFGSDELNLKYEKDFTRIFNLATIPFYWIDVEPEEGKTRYGKDSEYIYRRPAPDTCLEFCDKYHLEPKCHCLNYDFQAPTWVYDLSVEETKAKLEKRFKEISDRYSKIIPSFEVTNETLQTSHKNAFYMEDDFLEWSYRTADKYFKNNKLIINDYNIWDPTAHARNYYYMEIENLLNKGNIHLDSIGMQYHIFHNREAEVKCASEKYNPTRIVNLVNLLSKFGKKLQVTEMTIPAYSLDAEDEDIQAELIKNIYSLLFAQKSMEAIIYWNLNDGYGYGAAPGDLSSGENVYSGGLIRFDGTYRPAYKVLDTLINKEWHTEYDVCSNDGYIDVRGFKGEYEAEFESNGKQTIKFTID